MPFLDWNGNGEIDDEDIAVSVILDEEEENESSRRSNSSGGCLTSIVSVISITMLLIFALVAVAG